MKHVDTAKELLGEGRELTSFVSRLMDDIGDLKAMLRAISIGACHSVVLSPAASDSSQACQAWPSQG